MPAYVLGEIDVFDPDVYAEYRLAAQESIALHGGTYVLRGPDVLPLEGDWPLKRIVLLEFADVDAVRAWYDSPEYRKALELRERSAHGTLVILSQPS